MIPTKFLSNMGLYDIQISGLPLKVRVTDDPGVVDIGISELISQFGTTVVGVNVHNSYRFIHSSSRDKKPALLELCVGTRCLIIHTERISQVPESLKNFLENKEICFVGINGNALRYLPNVRGLKDLPDKEIVEVSDLVARFLKKPILGALRLEELAREVGVDLIKEDSAQDNVKVDWSAKVFSEEQIKHAVRDAHACYLIGKKIFG